MIGSKLRAVLMHGHALYASLHAVVGAAAHPFLTSAGAATHITCTQQ